MRILSLSHHKIGYRPRFTVEGLSGSFLKGSTPAAFDTVFRWVTRLGDAQSTKIESKAWAEWVLSRERDTSSSSPVLPRRLRITWNRRGVDPFCERHQQPIITVTMHFFDFKQYTFTVSEFVKNLTLSTRLYNVVSRLPAKKTMVMRFIRSDRSLRSMSIVHDR